LIERDNLLDSLREIVVRAGVFLKICEA